jgi:hypothetical protein
MYFKVITAPKGINADIAQTLIGLVFPEDKPFDMKVLSDGTEQDTLDKYHFINPACVSNWLRRKHGREIEEKWSITLGLMLVGFDKTCCVKQKSFN